MALEPGSIEARLAKLERENRWWRRLCMLFGVAGLALVMSGAAYRPAWDRSIAVGHLNIVDKHNRRVVSIGRSENGGYIFLYDVQGKNRIGIGVGKGLSSWISARHPTNDNKLIIIGTDSRGNPRMNLVGQRDGRCALYRDSKLRGSLLSCR